MPNRSAISRLLAIGCLLVLSGCTADLANLVDVFGTTATPRPANTATPTATATLAPGDDYDLDGLSNIEEIIKYGTDPYEQDSDGDGLFDSDWEERREYAYSVRVLIKIRQPFDLEAMNDIYQDARIVSEADDQGYAMLDILLFPITPIPVTPSAYPVANYPEDVQPYTLPGLTSNISQGMQEEVDGIVSAATNDVHAMYEILQWLSKNIGPDRNRHERAQVFYYTYLVDGTVYVRNLWPGLSGNEMLGSYFYADSMFWNRRYGDSCSYATLLCGMTRAAGLPCKIMQTIDPLYSHADQPDEYESLIERFWNDEYVDQPSGRPAPWINQCYSEVYLGGMWLRVGKTINFYQEPRFYEAYETTIDTLNIKIVSVADLTEVNFSQTWPTDWIAERPYYTLLIEDQQPIH